MSMNNHFKAITSRYNQSPKQVNLPTKSKSSFFFSLSLSVDFLLCFGFNSTSSSSSSSSPSTLSPSLSLTFTSWPLGVLLLLFGLQSRRRLSPELVLHKKKIRQNPRGFRCGYHQFGLWKNTIFFMKN